MDARQKQLEYWIVYVVNISNLIVLNTVYVVNMSNVIKLNIVYVVNISNLIILNIVYVNVTTDEI